MLVAQHAALLDQDPRSATAEASIALARSTAALHAAEAIAPAVVVVGGGVAETAVVPVPLAGRSSDQATAPTNPPPTRPPRPRAR